MTRRSTPQRHALGIALTIAMGALSTNVLAQEAEKDKVTDTTTAAATETCVEDPATPEEECPGRTELGNGAIATGTEASAIGANAYADGNHSTAVGASAFSMGEGATAVGSGATGIGDGSTAMGFNSVATSASTAVGAYAETFGIESTAIGWDSTAGDQGVAVGARSIAGDYGTAVGWYAETNGYASTAVGYLAWAQDTVASAFGYDSRAAGAGSTALGYGSRAYGVMSIALGLGQAWSTDSVAIGNGSLAYGDGSVAMGGYYRCEEACLIEASSAAGQNAVAIGAGAKAWADEAVALGPRAAALTEYSVALGHDSRVVSENSVAIGYLSWATRDNTVSFGNESMGIYRILTGIADGVEDHDAVNKRQLDAAIAGIDGVSNTDLSSAVAAFGGGASWNNGVFTAPTYTIQGASFNNAGDAFAALDGYISSLDARVSTLEASGGGNIPTGTGDGVAIGDGSHAENGNDVAIGNGSSATGGNSVAIGDGSIADEADTVSVGRAGAERRITNVADGVNDHDAANVGQMEAGDAATLAASRNYTDTKTTQAVATARTYTDQQIGMLRSQFDSFRDDVWSRLADQDKRIDRQGAMSSAMMSMSLNAAAAMTERGAIGVGAGFQNGESALSVGYSRRVGRATFSLGGAFTDEDQSVGIGFGFGL